MSEKRYTVMVDDNFHYMDEEQRYEFRTFATYEEAVAACRKIVDEELRDMLKQGNIPAVPIIEPEALSATWALYGSDPFILGGPRRFSARDYVAERVKALGGFKQER